MQSNMTQDDVVFLTSIGQSCSSCLPSSCLSPNQEASGGRGWFTDKAMCRRLLESCCFANTTATVYSAVMGVRPTHTHKMSHFT